MSAEHRICTGVRQRSAGGKLGCAVVSQRLPKDRTIARAITHIIEWTTPMQLRIDALNAHLSKGKFARVYTIASDEALLAIETADQIRAAARAAGFAERRVLHVDARWDWSQLAGSAQNLSLFGERRMVEVRLPTGKPGKEGAAALIAYARAIAAADDVVTLVALPRLDRTARESAWVKALDGAGVLIEVAGIARADLPAWIGQRLLRQGQRAGRNALELIAEQVEGNLLAAHQEVRKLALLYPSGTPAHELSSAQVRDSVFDVARFDAFSLPIAMLTGDAARVVRIIDRLHAEGEALPFVLWAVADEVRVLLRARQARDSGASLGALAREPRMWGPRERLLPNALERITSAGMAAAHARGADIDRLSKDLRAPRGVSDLWLEITAVSLEVPAT